MSTAPRLMVAVLQVERDPWSQIFRHGQEPTWMSTIPRDISLVNLFGRTPGLFFKTFDALHERLRWSVRGRAVAISLDRGLARYFRTITRPPYEVTYKGSLTTLRVGIFDSLLTLPIKELALFQFFLETSQSNYLYLTNTSSYVNLRALSDFVATLPHERVYGGTARIWKKRNLTFASGANRILSRDVVQIIVDRFADWDYRFLDDVSMGLLLQHDSLHFAPVPSMSFESVGDINAANKSDLSKVIHFRMKSGSEKSRIDHQLMLALHRALHE